MKPYKIMFLLFVLAYAVRLQAQAPYSLPGLPYAYAALEPYIDSATMNIHHSRHHQAYINNLNQALQGNPDAGMSLTELMKNISKYPVAVRNNGGGHYNHSLFWSILTPAKNTTPSKDLKLAIEQSFVSMDSMKTLINKAAATRFGSGWAWLYITPEGKLAISSTANQDNPLMDLVTDRGTPILGIDVWEHAYYLKYQNKRGDYLSAIWNVINWDEVSRRYHEVIPKKKGKFDDWPEILSFHKTLAATFHPSEDGDLKPIKAKSGELVQNALALSKSKIPAPFKSEILLKPIQKLLQESKAVDKLVRSKASDKKIITALNKLHDSFHTIVEECNH